MRALRSFIIERSTGVGIKINLHQTHRQYTNGQEVVEVNGNTVGECLKDLVRLYPELEKGIFDKKGNLLSVLEIYLNGASAYPDELKKEVKDGDEIHLLTMLAGG
jgi:molybdopterin converting factor small subunit